MTGTFLCRSRLNLAEDCCILTGAVRTSGDIQMIFRTKRNFGGWLAIGLMAASTGAFAQSAQTSTMPDAQVESNVLRALANNPDLSMQNIQTATVYGTVTLSGNVHDEAMRTKAENIVARTAGVKKVVDQLALGDTPAPATAGVDQQAEPDAAQGNVPQGQGQVLMSDGTYAPASGANQNGQPAPYDPSQGNGNGQPAPQYSQQQGPQPQYGQQGPPPQGRQPMYGNGYAQPNPNGIPGGQRAGIPVVIPAGAIIRIRINRGLSSNQAQPGVGFDGIVLTDVIAGNAVAIPRGATVTGTVVDAKKAGVFKGQGMLGLTINSVTLGGTVYPVVSQVWQHDGRDKTVGTVNNTIGTSAIGALFGAVIGGGEGAAIGAGVGAGAGLAGSAASPRGQVVIPPESVLVFTTAQPTEVRTVSEAEMTRLSYAAGPAQRPVPPRRYGPYGPGYYGPPSY
jgi:hypothetical protein